MRFILLIILFLSCFMGYFFILSFVGLLWCPSYKGVITNGTWFFIYSLALGWWLAAFSCIEYYEKYIENILKKDKTQNYENRNR